MDYIKLVLAILIFGLQGPVPAYSCWGTGPDNTDPQQWPKEPLMESVAEALKKLPELPEADAEIREFKKKNPIYRSTSFDMCGKLLLDGHRQDYDIVIVNRERGLVMRLVGAKLHYLLELGRTEPKLARKAAVVLGFMAAPSLIVEIKEDMRSYFVARELREYLSEGSGD